MKPVSKKISEATLEEMCTDKFKSDFYNMLRCRYPLFYISHNEEKRLIQFLTHFCKVKGYECFLWDSYNGLVSIVSGEEVAGISEDLKNNPLAILDHIIGEGRGFEKKKATVQDKKEKGTNGIIYVLLDYFNFIQPNPDIERRFVALSNLNTIVTTICTGPYYQSTDVIQNILPTMEFPFANKKEIRHALHDVVRGAERKIPDIAKQTKKIESELIDAVTGLTLQEAQTAFSISLVSSHSWDIPLILEQKKQLINKSGMLEYFDKTVKMDDIGGLKNLIEWIKERKQCFSQAAEDYGLNKPRGLLTIGMPGCGKSLVCKAISSAWKMPLLRLDFGKLFGSLVGDSEKNAREAIRQAEAVAPAILWIDEIEKAISGNSSSGRTDGGTTSRVLSTFLTWMQEKESPVFVIATANDHQAIPPEFLRAGRFDEIFFVDLPNVEEREEIFNVLLRIRGIDTKKINTPALAIKSDGFSGAEIEKAIDNAMLAGFMDKSRIIDTDDISKAMGEFKSLFEMRQSDFEELREWAGNKCRMANQSATNVVNHGQLTSAKDLDL
jgi:ATP-dependent 26S proteasome regulatory subunit